MTATDTLRRTALWLTLSACTVAYAGTPGPTYTLLAAHSSLTYTFKQAGAANTGRFKTFSVRFDPHAGTLSVVIDMRSLDTGDGQRNGLLGGHDFFDVARYPQARFTAARLQKTTTGYLATGPLTLRGVTHTVEVPFTWRTVQRGGRDIGTLDGAAVIRRLEFGVGQGQWRATEWLGNAVTVRFTLDMTSAAG